MKSFTIAALVCVAASTSGAPQFFGNFGQPAISFKSTNNYNSFGIPESGDHIINTNGGPTWNTKFGKLPFSGKNLMSRQERAQYLPIMKALLKVMETNRPSAQDINTLLKLSRDLAKQSPKGQFEIPLGLFGGFGIDDIESMGLPKTGDVIKVVDGVANIKTQFGLFPLSDTSLMTEAERQQFLPAVRTFTNILQKDNLSVDEMNLLLEQSRELTNALKQTTGQDGGAFGLGGFGGFGDSSTSYNDFLLPETGNHIVNVPGQGPSFNTAIGKFPLGKNRMTKEERARFLPVMKALLKVMQTNRPAPADVNTLLVLSRDLSKYVPKGDASKFSALASQFGDFGSLDSLEDMGIPKTGDVIKTINGKPHIKTTFGLFPLSDVSLMTDAERQRFLPSVRTFISVLEKDNLDANEMNILLDQSRELLNLIPENFISQFGLGGFGN